ncbi:hypothetical protein HUO13_06435 [Saccharopolyspora erythraea]|uniref:hypothetical protein n=1 Tax=Saccharopolyspora erythraea TaxID=1836 RepID=UPI001BA4BDF0|nr:hypothetical protein [Saccharopolyspora erythraea]QUH00502.1 hypothetical protein HUO13_06435 [Saccharopolyspora erythraea]
MDTTTDATLNSRSRRDRRPDPARVWEPLAGLADAAQSAAAGSGAVAITRGFDRNSRQRAKALRELLGQRGVAAVEVTPASGSERLLADTEVAAVVNLVGAGSWQPYRLGAKLRAAVFTPGVAGDEPASRDVIGMAGDDGQRDVALSHIAVRPEDPSAGSLAVVSDGEPLSVPGGRITVTLRDERLEVHLSGPDFAGQSFTATEIRVETFDGPHRLVRDELPIAEFEGAVTFTAEPRGLRVQAV